MSFISKELSQAISSIRLPLAFLIVCGHADILHFPIVCGSGEWASYDDTIIKYPIIFICRVLFSPAVPLFFAISGFLFFSSSTYFSKDIYLKKIRKRITTLVIPYVIWQLIFLSPSLISVILGKHDYSVMWFIQSIWSYPGQTIPADPPLWFMRDLIVCIVFAPVYYLLLRKMGIGLVVLLLLLLGWTFDIWPLPQLNGLSSHSITFFALGSYIGIHKFEVSSSLNRYGRGILFVFLLVAIMDMFTTQYVPLAGGKVEVECIAPLNNIIVLLAFAVYPYLAMRFKSIFNHFNVGGSFIIYACHWGALLVVNTIITKLCSSEISSFTALALFLLRVAFGFFGAFLLGRVISRNETLLRLFAGGRI